VLTGLGVLYKAARLDGRMTRFDPTDPVSLVVASSAGGLKNVFNSRSAADPREMTAELTRVQFGEIGPDRYGLMTDGLDHV